MRIKLLIFSLLFGVAGWGQVIGFYPSISDGFEGRSMGTTTTTLAQGTQYTDWILNNATSASASISNTGGRSGPYYVTYLSTFGGTRRISSPTVQAANAGGFQTSTSYVIQYWYKNNGNTAAFGTAINLDGTANWGTTETVGTLTNTSGVWTKRTVVLTTNAGTAPVGISGTSSRFGHIQFRSNASMTNGIDIDDVVVYAGSSADITPANMPSAITVNNPTATSLDVSWGAASGGVDGGGYVVVRYSTNPNADNDPNQNGIYAVGNTTSNGTGGLIGTIVYVGTGTSFTNTGLSSGSQYWYKVYTVDKAFNYSSEVLDVGTTLSSPEINIQGNSVTILDGDSTPSTTDDTDFGATTASTNLVKTYTIQNTGTANLSVSNIAMSTGSVFTVGGITLPASIAGGASSTFTVTFNSAATGTFNDVVNVISNDTDEATYNYNVQASVVTAPVITSVLTSSGSQGSAFNYTITATNSPTSFSATGLPAGLSINTTTGVISGTPTVNGTFNVTIGATNIAGSDSQTLVITLTVSCYIGTFETALKGSYADSPETVDGLDWLLIECLVGNSASDYKIGVNSARIRVNSSSNVELVNQLTTGLSTIGFSYRNYTGDVVSAIFSVDISKDNGISWVEVGTISPTSSVQNFLATVNQSGNYKVRIKYKSGTTNNARFNIDNIELCPYSSTREIEVFGNSTSVIDGTTSTKISNDTDFGANYFIGDPAIVKTFTVTNYGTGTLNLSGLSISGSSDFTVSALSATTLSAGASATFTVSFSTASSGLKSAEVTILSDDADESPFTFAVSCFSNNFVKCSLQAISTIAFQDFEGSGTLGYTGLGTVAGGQNYGDNRTTTSNKFIGTQSYQINNLTNTIEFNNLDTSNYKNVQFSFRIGAYSTTTTQGLDAADKIIVSLSTDGGTTWLEQIAIRGNNSAIFDINTSAGSPVSVRYDNTITSGRAYGMASNSTNTFPNSFTITNIPSVPQLKIRLAMSTNAAFEIWALDEVRVQGQLPQSTIWNGSSWSAGVPTANTKAVFDGSYTTAIANVEACECQINATGSLTINSNNYIEVQSHITNNGTFNILNNGSLIQVDDSSINTGNINLQRTALVDFRDYVYWSTPVANFNSANISTFSDNSNLYKWIPTVVGNGAGDFGNWTNGTETMVLGKGYIERGLNNSPLNSPVNFTSTFTGVPNNGSITTPISRGTYNTVGTYPSPYSTTNATQDDDNWNLLGNPYPSAISADAFLTANSSNLDGFVKIWLHGIAPSTSALDPFYNNYGYNYDPNDYLTYNLSGPSIPGVFDGYIGAGQGFITRMSATSSSTSTNAVFNNSMRSKTYRNDQFYKNSNANSSGRIWIDLVSSTASNSTLIAYVNGATNGKDQMYDASANLKANFSIYSLLDGYDRNVIQGRSLPFNQNDQVPLAIKIPSNGNYTIAIKGVDGFFSNASQPIYLEDKQANVIHDLRSSPYYFTSSSGEFAQRFILRYTNQTLGNDQFEVSDNSVKIYASDNSIVINSSVEPIKTYEIYNVLGQTLVSKKQLNVNKAEENSIQKNNQALIVKVTLENGKTINKKVIF